LLGEFGSYSQVRSHTWPKSSGGIMDIECKCGRKLMLKQHEGGGHIFSAKCQCGRYWILEDLSRDLRDKIDDNDEDIGSLF